MYRLNDKERRAGGFLLEALVLVFVFSSAWSPAELSNDNERGQLVVKTSHVEQIAFCDSGSYIKSLLDFVSKVQVVGGDFTEFVADPAGLAVATTNSLNITHSLYNSFYTHLTAKAP